MSDTLIYLFLALVALVVVIVLFRAMRPASPEQPIEELHTVPEPDETPTDAEQPPAAVAEDPAPAPAEAGDPLTRIKGLGPRAEKTLNAMGVARFEQIARWTAADIEAAAAGLGENFDKRIERDRWVEQAGLLARDEIAAFEEKFGKIG